LEEGNRFMIAECMGHVRLGLGRCGSFEEFQVALWGEGRGERGEVRIGVCV
jgi:hypothetical protein